MTVGNISEQKEKKYPLNQCFDRDTHKFLKEFRMGAKEETVFFQEGQGHDYMSPPRNISKSSCRKLPLFLSLL